MKLLAFEDLARLAIVGFYESAFRKATGVSLKVIPAEGGPDKRKFGAEENEFCRLVACTPAGCTACTENELRAQRRVARTQSPIQLHCYAGLTVLAAPVKVEGRHVATLLSGQIFRREPTERDFQLVVKMLGGAPDANWLRETRRAYMETPVLTSDRFQAVVQLLEVFTQYLSEVASRQAIACSETEPSAVANAKQFINDHVEDRISLAQVVEHVHVSRFYFCKLFKKATGMTLTEYVTRVRVEKAKALLGDPSRRVSEVVFASGFGSIPQFNNVFRRYVGMAPSEYRAGLQDQSVV